MRSGFFTAVFLTFYLALPAQNVQPSEAFPFSITLFRTDSTTLPSAQVLKKGKPTVLAFWLTTCLPCHIELGSYAKNYEAWKKEADFNLFAISIDFQERFAKVQEMTREKKWPFPVYWDAHRAFKNILPGGLNGLPQVFLFDKEGKLVWQHKRYASGDEAELFAQIKALK
ncbi:MAG: TlpA family protein disulfide reductase [Saprospiraceae bacterium]|nr:TlpA family protein disulfide reductase [Saprospiraceae bacterium]MCB0542047.1 TlpA family protein disulfide reductase [Saprospiraceae bacterium]MCB0575860.1 TlpA family protein disulfide reductase [Saprospiraceae bacterium]MCB9305622.1 TlpA family protein disulfide reductase [Lewinellaceae bacterium]MCB9354133.1 TlpA family protein disulfide reductase [Lewinellaceae bacterium]